MPEAKRLEKAEVEVIIDRIPGFRDRLRMHQHEIATRLELENLRTQGGDARQIVDWLRNEFLAGRSGTVRGDFGLRIAEMIESGAYRQEMQKEAVV